LVLVGQSVDGVVLGDVQTGQGVDFVDQVVVDEAWGNKWSHWSRVESGRSHDCTG
jgi:hypothetical protein